MRDSTEVWIQRLGSLEGSVFENEVCAFLHRCFHDFQAIPDPGGDGGLDGLSHRQSRGYCCYGPEQEPFKKKTKGLKSDIVEKFKSDLRRLFELKRDGKKLVEAKNTRLKGILAEGQKVKSIFLIVSVFRDNQVIGPINTSFREYLDASECRFVEESATLAIWGPRDLAAAGVVDDTVLLRSEAASSIARAKKIAEGESLLNLDEERVFDAKFDWLEGNVSANKGLSKLREDLKRKWTLAVALDQQLANEALLLHESLEHLRSDVVIDAQLKSASTESPIVLLADMRNLLGKRLQEQLESQLGQERADILKNGETARLIGECSIDWRGQ